MAQQRVCLATQVFEIIENAKNRQLDSTTFQLVGLAYERFNVDATLYFDVECYLNRVAVRILNIHLYGHFIDQIEPGLTCLVTAALSQEAAANDVMRGAKHLYALRFVKSVEQLRDTQTTFILPASD